MGIEQRNMYVTGQPPVAGTHSWVGYLLGLNPAGAMMSLFDSSFSKEAFLLYGGNLNSKAPIELWLEFVIVYSVVIVLALWIAIRNIRPVARRRKGEEPAEQLPQDHSTSENGM
jgi:hypothetical protein